MKIVIAVPHYPPHHIGGTELMAQRFARHFASQGNRVDVVCIESITAAHDHPFCVTETDDGIMVHRLYYNQSQAHNQVQWGFENPLIKTWFQSFLRDAQPDILHILSGYLLSGSIIDAGSEQGIPMVVTLLDFWFVCPLITLLRANGELCPEPVPPTRCAWCLLSSKRRYKLSDQYLGGKLGDGFTLLAKNKAFARLFKVDEEIATIEARRNYLKNMLEKVDLVITHSHFLEKKVRDYGISPRQWVYLPNGIEILPSEPHEPKISPAHPVRIGYLGQIAPHKGVDVLVEAYMEAESSPGQSELHIFGDIKQWPGYSKKLIIHSKNNQDVFWEGPFQAAKLPEVLNRLDVVVVPSIWFENRPTVILEAFSHGIPVIASNLGGMAEMVENGVSGLLFEAGNAHDLAVQLKSIISQPSILETLKNGIQSVKTSLEENEQIEKLYAQLILKHSVPEI